MNLFCEAIIFFNQKSLQNKKYKNRNCLTAVKIFLKILNISFITELNSNKINPLLEIFKYFYSGPCDFP